MTSGRFPLARALPVLLALLAPACSSDPDVVELPKVQCKVHGDCPNSEACFQGQCYATTSCLERKNCRNVPVCADDQCFCDTTSNRCLPACVTDNDCAEDGYCVDGVCTAYPVEFGGMPATGTTRGALSVGLSKLPLDYPMGVELAGYGSRQGPRGPYTKAFGGSNAWFDRPDVRAAAFDDGKEVFVLLRLPLSWTVDFVVAATTLKVKERTGLDLSGRIITSAPHSHSQPARYWHLVNGYGFGFFGYGEFSFEVFERMTTSFADAVVMALEDRQPARLGHLQLDDFDPEDKIHRDRRNQNDNLPGYIGKDGRLILMRVDDLEGRPRAIFTHFGMHGTVFDFDNPVITQDAGGGVETELTRLASAKYGHPVLGFYLQGNAGDQSPGGDDHGHNPFEQLQLIGQRTWAAVEGPFDSLQTKTEVQVGVVQQRIELSHSALGYTPGAFFDSDVSCDAAPPYFRYGAFQCVEGRPGNDSDPATFFKDGDLNCVFALECLTDGRPVPQFQKTVLAVVRLGSLAFATMPGEPLSQFGRDVSERLKSTIPGVTEAAVLGYSMDHHFYLMNEDDWLQGGYEPSRDIWGWRLGPHLADHSITLAAELGKEPEARVIDDQNFKPEWWVGTEEETAWVAFTETTGDPAEVLQDLPATVERLQEVSFVWAGGHPGLDLPHVVLEREGPSGFAPVLRPGDLPYDDSGFETIVRYEGTCSRSNCNMHRWRLRWQEQRNFPLGRYRFRVEGRAWKGGAQVDYATQSRTFEVVPSRRLELYGLEWTAMGLLGRISYPPEVELVEKDGALITRRSAFLLRSLDTPSEIGAALPDGATLTVTGRVRLPSGAEQPLAGEVDVAQQAELRRRLVGKDALGQRLWEDERSRPASRFTVSDPNLNGGPAGAYWVELTLTDTDGNSGTVTATVTR